MSAASDLRQRLLGLASRLDALLARRERASRARSFAEARQRTGATHEDAETMAGYTQDELTGDAEITDIRREIRSIDDDLKRAHEAGGLRARASRLLRSRHR